MFKKLKEQQIAAIMLGIFVLFAILVAFFAIPQVIRETNEPEEEEKLYMTVNLELEEVNGITIQHSYIPYDSPRRPGEIREIKYITIHETDNRSRGANASAHDTFMRTDVSDITSWHYTVDSEQIFHHIPDNEISWNAGDNRQEDGGNMNGIAIEMCVNVDGDFEQTVENTAILTAQLLVQYGLTPEDVRLHQDFMNKVCPHRLISEGRVEEFYKTIAEEYERLKALTAESEIE